MQEQLTGSLVVPALNEAGTSVAQLAYEALRNAILRFHQRILELGHSDLIAGMADTPLVHVRAICRHTIGEEDRVERSIVDHLRIIEALEARDAELAERLVRDHALALARHVERTLPDWTDRQ